MTKKISEIQEAEKEYSGSFILGATTASYDLESEVIPATSPNHISKAIIFETVEKFKGKLLQVPPAHSAVKINGIRSYIKARKGQAVMPEAKEVHIKEFEITNIQMPQIDFRVVCSKGTYIRSLANDFGKELGCGAYLSALSRDRIGEYSLKNALTIEDFISQYESETRFTQSLITN